MSSILVAEELFELGGELVAAGGRQGGGGGLLLGLRLELRRTGTRASTSCDGLVTDSRAGRVCGTANG